MKGRFAGFLAGFFLLQVLVGCGGGNGSENGAAPLPGTGGGGIPADNSVGIFHGIVVDPYIEGATFFEDTNDNGRWDQGEQISTPSDEFGRFSFASPVPVGRTIIMHERGYHQGVPFTGRLLLKIEKEGSEAVVVSPLTTLTALGLPAAELSFLLSFPNNHIEYDFAADPMAGLERIDSNNYQGFDREIASLRANLLVGAILELFMLNRDSDWMNAADLRYLFSNWEPFFDLMEGLHYAVGGEALVRVEEKLSAGYNLPPVTMREVAEATPAILNWWRQEIVRQVIEAEEISISADDFKDKVDKVQADLALHYYVLNNQHAAVQQAISNGHLPPTDGKHVALQKDGKIGSATPKVGYQLLENQVFTVGNNSQLRFFERSDNGKGAVELSYQSGYGFTTKIAGIWSNEGDELLLRGSDSDEILRLELETDWSSHLSLRIKSEPRDDLPPTSFLGRLLMESSHFRVGGGI